MAESLFRAFAQGGGRRSGAVQSADGAPGGGAPEPMCGLARSRSVGGPPSGNAAQPFVQPVAQARATDSGNAMGSGGSTGSGSAVGSITTDLSKLPPGFNLVDFGELELAKLVGEGSFGQVWLARWCQTTVAVKVRRPPAAPPARCPPSAAMQTA